MAKREFTAEEIKKAISLYNQCLSLKAIGQQIGCNFKAVRRILKENKVQIRNRYETVCRRQGVPIQTPEGYIRIGIPSTDPMYCMGVKNGKRQSGPNTKRYVLEHRYVMANHLGRPLERWEIVHHINHVRDDNRIENLELHTSEVQHNAETHAHREFMKMKGEIEELKELVNHLALYVVISEETDYV